MCAGRRWAISAAQPSTTGLRNRWTLAATLCAAAALASSTAHAQPAPTPPTAEQVEEGRRHFERGVGLFDQGNHDGALIEFQRAWEPSSAPGALQHRRGVPGPAPLREGSRGARAPPRELHRHPPAPPRAADASGEPKASSPSCASTPRPRTRRSTSTGTRSRRTARSPSAPAPIASRPLARGTTGLGGVHHRLGRAPRHRAHAHRSGRSHAAADGGDRRPDPHALAPASTPAARRCDAGRPRRAPGDDALDR